MRLLLLLSLCLIVTGGAPCSGRCAWRRCRGPNHCRRWGRRAMTPTSSQVSGSCCCHWASPRTDVAVDCAVGQGRPLQSRRLRSLPDVASSRELRLVTLALEGLVELLESLSLSTAALALPVGLLRCCRHAVGLLLPRSVRHSKHTPSHAFLPAALVGPLVDVGCRRWSRSTGAA